MWEGKPHVSAGKEAIGVRYEVTNQRQSLAERGLGIGNVTVISTDPSTLQIVLKKIADPQKVKEPIRQAAREEKQRQGLTYREFL